MESFVSKKFTLKAIIQVARSLGAKSLVTNRILIELEERFVGWTDLKPLDNDLQPIKPRFCGVITYKAF